MAQPQKRKKKALVLGVGLDSDGHKRLTTGPNFALVGGTEETHAAMTEKAAKINEKLAAKGKTLENVSRDEFDDIAQSVGLQRRPDKDKDKDEKKNENEARNDECLNPNDQLMLNDPMTNAAASFSSFAIWTHSSFVLCH